MPEMVTDPLKVTTDPVLLKELARQGIDKDYVVFSQDYASRSLGKGHSPYAKFYKDLKSNKQWMVASGLPMVDADGNKIECGWRVAGINYFAEKNNLFRAKVQGTSVELTVKNDQPDGRKAGDKLSYNPQLFLDGIEQIPSQSVLLPVDPVNPNYLENTLEWDYGICKRRLRIIQGKLLGSWVFDSNPAGEVRIKYNQSGDYRLRLGQFKINDDEELVKPEDFDELAQMLGYPVTVSDSATYYPDAHTESTSVDGAADRNNDPAFEAWATIKAGVGTIAYDAETWLNVYIRSVDATDKWHYLRRVILLFDTSGLSDFATISAATLSLYGDGKLDENSLAPTLNIYSSNPASNTAIAAADFTSLGSTAFCDTAITYNDWISADPYWNNFAFNAAGLAAISKDGITKLGVREGRYDVGSETPAWSYTGQGQFYCAIKPSEAGAGYKPKLVVTYTTGTWQISADADNVVRTLENDQWDYGPANMYAGGADGTAQRGCGLRFQNITIPQGVSITSAYLTFRCSIEFDFSTCNTRISAEDVDDAAAIADDKAAFDTRWAARTTARVDWDAIPNWTVDSDYNSPEIKTVIQEIVDRGGWASGQDILIFWEDFEDRSTHTNYTIRCAYSYGGSATYAPKLVITYTTFTEYSESASVIVGVLASASRVAAYDRNSSVISGIVATASRTLTYTRASSVISGIVATAARVLAATRVSSVITGIVATASRAATFTRTASVISGIVTSASRAVTYTRTASVISGIVATATRIANYPRAASVIAGVVATATRTLTFTRASSVISGVIASATRRVTYTRASSVISGIVATATKSWGRTVSSSVIVGIVASATRALTYSRTSAVISGIVASASRALAYNRASSVISGVVASATRTLVYTRTSSVISGVVASASKSWNRTVSASVIVGVLVSATRSVTYNRASFVISGIVASASRAMTYTRTAEVISGVVVTATRTLAFIRSLTTSVGLATVLTRSQGHIRTLTTSIGLYAFDIITRYWQRRRVRDIGTDRTLSIVGTDRTLSSIGTDRTLSIVGTDRDVEDIGTDRKVKGW